MPSQKKIKILAIETSCDETAISIIEASGGFKAPKFKILAQAVSSQIKLHATWGGVVPNLAKREHEKNFTPLLDQVLREAKLLKESKNNNLDGKQLALVKKYLTRETDLAELLIPFLIKNKIPKVDAIAVTEGPGLEPALWVGINATRALAAAWNLPIIPTNHMEGHIYSTLINAGGTKNVSKKSAIKFPALALLISGGHTELVLIKDYLKYKVIGATRDDAVGEAFDKVARILGLPYPGGPEISRLAEKAGSSATFLQCQGVKKTISFADLVKLPRPMINSGDFDFSFSGLKTAVLYKVRDLTEKGGYKLEDLQVPVAKEFQDAVIEVLTKKTLTAAKKFKVKSIIIGGGVIANKALREAFNQKTKDLPGTNLLIPEISLTGDNATMIAAAAYFRHLTGKRLLTHKQKITARGDLSLT